MSLFPIRLRPGGTITVHVRMKVSEPRWVHRHDTLVDPLGRRTLCHDRWLLITPPVNVADDEKLAQDSGQILGGAPLLMAARFLQTDTKRPDYFVDMFRGLRDSVHHYYTVTLPPDA